MNLLVIDIGGTNVKLLATGAAEARRFPSGKEMSPDRMVCQIREITRDWSYEAIAIGYPGIVKHGRIITDPHNLAKGWSGFDFEAAFRLPVRIINDAAMQALGSYRDGVMLFLGLGTGLGSALVIDGKVVPLELAHLGYKKGTFEDYLGARGLERLGRKKWCKQVACAVARLQATIIPDDLVIGGGNARKLDKLPDGCRIGGNQLAFAGGFRLWGQEPPANLSDEHCAS